MSKSFSIDLKAFPLYRPIPGGEKILQGTIGPYEVSQVLMDLGYADIDEYSEVLPFRFGIIPALTETLAEATMGIPSTAQIKVKRLGGKTRLLLLTFNF